MRRLTWFVGGVAAGAAGTNYATKKVREAGIRRADEKWCFRGAAAFSGSMGSGKAGRE